MTTRRVLLTLKGHSSWIQFFTFSPDGRRILTGSDDNTAKLWETTTGREVLTLKGHSVVVGASREDSNATGVNGNQTDRTAMDSGAAYVYTGFGTATQLALASDGSGGYVIKFKGIPDLSYRLQRARSVTGPWDTITTNISPASGLIEYHETTPPPAAAFYRWVQP